MPSYDYGMKLTRFLTDAHMKGGTPIPDELDPLPLIITRIGVNRYTPKSQALARICQAVAATEGEMVESDLWTLGNDARGLLNAFAMRRMLGKYGRDSLDMLAHKLSEFMMLSA